MGAYEWIKRSVETLISAADFVEVNMAVSSRNGVLIRGALL